MTPMELNVVQTGKQFGWTRRTPIGEEVLGPIDGITTILLAKDRVHVWVYLTEKDTFDEIVVSSPSGSVNIPTTFRNFKKALQGEL